MHVHPFVVRGETGLSLLISAQEVKRCRMRDRDTYNINNNIASVIDIISFRQDVCFLEDLELASESGEEKSQRMSLELLTPLK